MKRLKNTKHNLKRCTTEKSDMSRIFNPSMLSTRGTRNLKTNCLNLKRFFVDLTCIRYVLNLK